MKRLLLAGWWSLALAGCFLAGSAQAAQSVGGVRVIEVPAGDEVTQLAVENRNLAAVTLTVQVTGQNVKPDHSMPMVVTCPGQGTFPFVRLKPAREDEGFSWRVKSEWLFGQTGVKPDRRFVYELPFEPGKRFLVRQGFHGSFTHTGNAEYAVDFEMPEGTPIHAAREGTVEVTMDRFSEGGEDIRYRDDVNFILIRHSDGTYGEYVHLRQGGVKVAAGQKVKAREFLGYSGNTGYTQGPHLHFAVFRAINGTKRETFPMRFRAAEDKDTTPTEGQFYTAPRD